MAGIADGIASWFGDGLVLRLECVSGRDQIWE